jgi:MFS transporter, PAT family, beta-lactamase induction signal transducer AmpG
MKRSHWLLIASLYTTQFLPVSFFFMGLPAILRSEGRTLEELGALYLLGFVWVLKIFWAPVVDRFSVKSLGRYRGWIIIMQSAMILLLLVIGRFGSTTEFTQLLFLSLALTVFAATQDIATDALTIKLLPAEQRSWGNSFQVAGGLVGIVLGGGATLILYQTIGWMGCFVLMAAVLAIALVQVIIFDEPADDTTEAAKPVGYSRLLSFWKKPGTGRWIVTMLTLPIGIGMTFGLLTPMLVDIGWPMDSVGFTINIVGSLVGLVAVFIMGWLVQRFGRRTMIVTAAFAQALAILAILPLASGSTTTWQILPGLLAVFLIYNPLATVMLTVMMDRCDPQSAGTDFTAQYSLYSFVGFACGAVALNLASSFGYSSVIALACVIATAAGGIALLLFPSKENETQAVGLKFKSSEYPQS